MPDRSESPLFLETGFSFEDEKAQEECGLVALIPKDGNPMDPEAATALFTSLRAINNRGMHAAGISLTTPDGVVTVCGDGEVHYAIDTRELMARFPKHAYIGIAHTRWATAGVLAPFNRQPIVCGTLVGAINGNSHHARNLDERYGFALPGEYSDTNRIVHAVAEAEGQLEEAVAQIADDEAVRDSTYTALFARGTRLVFARDRVGRRPAIGGTATIRDREYHMIGSETAAFDAIGARYEEEIPPGEIRVFEGGKRHTHREGSYMHHQFCSFEDMYFCRPDSRLPIPGVRPEHWPTVESVRESVGYFMGQIYAKQLRACDLLIPVPNSGIPFTRGLARGAGMEALLREDIFLKFRRVFIQGEGGEATQATLQKELILNPERFPDGRDVNYLLTGKTIGCGDDSTVIGDSTSYAIRLLRSAGASGALIVNSMPPIAYDCQHGSNLKEYDRRLYNAQGGNPEKMARAVGAHALLYPDHQLFVIAVQSAMGRDVHLGAPQGSELFRCNRLCGECFASIPITAQKGRIFSGIHLQQRT